MSEVVEKIEGIGPKYGSKLADVGIFTLNDLRNMDIASVHTKTGLSVNLLEQWKSMAHLQCVSSIDPQIAEVLVRKLGIMNLTTLARANPTHIVGAIQAARTPRTDYNIIPDSYTRPVTIMDVTAWRTEAKDAMATWLECEGISIYKDQTAILSVILMGFDGKPVSGKRITFSVWGEGEVGSATTDDDGKATFSYKPDTGWFHSFYTYEANFEGDDDYQSSWDIDYIYIHEKCTLEGKVELEGSEDWSGVIITLESNSFVPFPSESDTGSKTSSPEGDYSFYPLPDYESVDLSYYKEGYYHEFRQLVQIWPPKTIFDTVKMRKIPPPVKISAFYAEPEPFTDKQTVHFELTEDAHVEIKIYNEAGDLVRNLLNETKPSGLNEVVWDGKDNHGRSVGGSKYLIKIHARNDSGSDDSTVESVKTIGPVEISAFYGEPNPFTGRQTVHFELTEDAHVEIKIYNEAGDLVRDLLHEGKSSGVNEVVWDRKNDQGKLVGCGKYQIKIHATNEVGEAESTFESIKTIGPVKISAFYAYPNPFSDKQTVRFELTEDAHVEIKIYNLVGERVRNLLNETKPSGVNEVVWDGRNNHGNSVASGTYIIKIVAKNNAGSADSTFKSAKIGGGGGGGGGW